MKGFIQPVLSRVARGSWRRPLGVLFLAGVLTGAAVCILVRVEPQTDIVTLLPSHDPVARAFLDLVETGSALEAELIYVTTGSGKPEPEGLVAFADRLAARLEGNALVAAVDYRVPDELERYVRDIFLPHALVYLDAGELDRVADLLTPESIERSIAKNATALAGGASMFTKRLIAQDPLGLHSVLLERLQRFRGQYRFDFDSRHYLSADGRAILLKVAGRRPAQDIDFARALHDEIDRAVIAANPGGLRVRYGGAYAIALETSGKIRRDMIVTITAAIVAIVVLFAAVYRRPLGVVFALIPLGMGLTWGFAVYVLASGAITVITAVGGGMLAGLGVDFTIHILSRHEISRDLELSAEERMTGSVTRCGIGVVAAALTTAAGFATFSLTDFPGVRQLGLLGFAGILTTLAATIWVLPAVIRLSFARGLAGRRTRSLWGFGLAALGGRIHGRPWPWVIGAGLVTLAAAIFLLQHATEPLTFEGDFRQMHPSGSESLALQQEVFDKFGGSFESTFLVTRGASREQVVETFRKTEQALNGLVKEGLIVGYASAGMLLPDPAGLPERRARIKQLDADRIRNDLVAALERHGFVVERYTKYLDFLRTGIEDDAPVDPALFESTGLGALFDPFVHESQGAFTGVATLSLKEAHWLKSEREQVYQRIRDALAAATPEIVLTGLGPVSVRLESLIRRDVSRIVVYLLIAVVVIVYLHFRRVWITLLVLMPVALTLVWLLAVMKIAGLHVNLVNIVVFPLIIGIGIDDALHLMFRYREPEGGDIIETLRSTGHAVVMTSITTILGFGSVAISSTPGIRSLGYVAILGVLGALIASLVVLPAVLRVMEGRMR